MIETATYIPILKRNTFRTPLRVTPLADGVRWQLDSPLEYVDPDGNVIEIPTGFITDFASIPALASIAGIAQLICIAGFFLVSLGFAYPFAFAWWVIMQADKFEHEGTWDEASCLHDWCYATRCRSFTKSNWLLLVSMTARGGGRTALWKRLMIWLGVSAGGWFAWQADARKASNRDLSKPLSEPNKI